MVTLDPTDDAAEERLASLSGQEFDSAYNSVIGDSLKRDVDEFLQASSSASNPQIKILAALRLPVPQNELSELRQIEAAATKRQKAMDVA